MPAGGAPHCPLRATSPASRSASTSWSMGSTRGSSLIASPAATDAGRSSGSTMLSSDTNVDPSRCRPAARTCISLAIDDLPIPATPTKVRRRQPGCRNVRSISVRSGARPCSVRPGRSPVELSGCEARRLRTSTASAGGSTPRSSWSRDATRSKPAIARS